MEPFIVSARKYRPATFDTVIGQEAITGTLKNAIRNQQLAQAFLFCGPRGVGKTTCARILAKTINCKQLTENIEPCNACDSCLSFDRSASFNVYELDAASNNSVEDIRSLVDQVRIPPQAGKYKVYIIDEVHMLSLSAFNAFLKTLEEPPAYAKFILATTEKHKIIPTILSRCQIFDFKRIPVDGIVRQLKYVATREGIEADPDGLHTIGIKADGSLRDALSIFDQLVSFSGKTLRYADVINNLNVLDYEYYFRMTKYMLEEDLANALLLVHEVLGNGFDGQHFLVGLGEHFRNLLVAGDERMAGLLEVPEGYRSRYLEQAVMSKQAWLLRALETTNEYDLNYKSASLKQLHLELAVMKLCALTTGAANREGAGQAVSRSASQSPQPAAKVMRSEKPAPTPTPQQTSVAPEVKSKVGLGLDPKLSQYGTIALKDKVEKAEEKPMPVKEAAETPFREEDLHMYWQAYAGKFRQEKPNLYTTLSAQQPALLENWAVSFEVDNKVQQQEVEAQRQDLLGFLKQSLNNTLISLKVEVVKKSNDQVRPYAPSDKYKHMTEINPDLQLFRDTLQLDLDY
ncbi:MAG TPA: DNA polymerase III subunit gamma/tau [Bacteroidales bacterium]|nr:DNA polymerase III subunit gamma/tau [Bacteroidales bacterium]